MATTENQLIARLPRKDRRPVIVIADKVTLAQSEILSEPGDPIRYVYFPIDSFISLVTTIDGKPVIEVGMVRNEGMLGAQVALGVLTRCTRWFKGRVRRGAYRSRRFVKSWHTMQRYSAHCTATSMC